MQSTRGCESCDPGDEPSPHVRLPLLDLAPAGGCLAADVTTCAGSLLHHLFTLATLLLYLSKCFHLAELKRGCGLFLWPYPSGCPVPGVTRHLALWSADFP